MISLKKCEADLNECQALGAEGKLTLRRATAVMAVCHAWLALSDAVREYETIVGEEDGFPKCLRDSLKVVACGLGGSVFSSKRMDGPARSH